MMAYVDYYKILGIDRDATQDDVRKAYKKPARKYHPDLNPNDPDAHRKFQEINEAHEAPGDPEKRRKYDQYGGYRKHADEFEAQRQQHRRSQSGQADHAYWTESGDGSGFSDFFEQMFGGMGGRRSRRSQYAFRGEDHTTKLQVSMADAAKTHKQIVSVNGENLRITIPADDLYVTFVIPGDACSKRVGDDLCEAVPLDMHKAVLGGEQIVDTLDGKVKLHVKPGTQNDTKVRLKGKGFPVYKEEGRSGDLIVTCSIDVPTNLTDRRKEPFREMQSLAG